MAPQSLSCRSLCRGRPGGMGADPAPGFSKATCKPCPRLPLPRRSACSHLQPSLQAQASSMTLISRTMSCVLFGSAIGRSSTGVCSEAGAVGLVVGPTARTPATSSTLPRSRPAVLLFPGRTSLSAHRQPPPHLCAHRVLAHPGLLSPVLAPAAS